MKILGAVLVLSFLSTCCQENSKHVEIEHANHIVCVYGIKYWRSSSHSILTLLVDMDGKPLVCE